jgi:chemotaxis protein histidine kinase CheA
MKDRARTALAIATGYYLGRRHRLRWATALAAAGAASRLRGGGGVLKQANKLVGSSPELEKITDRLRGDLAEVGKAAVVAATSRQIEALSTKLHERAEALRHPAVPEEVTELAEALEEIVEEPSEGEEAEEEEAEYEEEPAEKPREETAKARRESAPQKAKRALRAEVPKPRREPREESPAAKSGRARPVTRTGG